MKNKVRIALLLAALAVLALPVGEAAAAPSKKKQTVKAVKATKAAKPVTVKKSAVTKAKRVAVKPRAVSYDDVQDADNLLLRSQAVLVQDQSSGEVLFEKNSDAVVAIASITKLMTAIVVLDAQLGLTESLSIDEADVDTLRHTRSRLRVGLELSREDLLRLALMSSENRAASALSRHYPGGEAAFIAAMNRKAQELGLRDTHFNDATGLDAGNVSSARDLVKLVSAASGYALIREMTTTPEYTVEIAGRLSIFRNTNALVKSPDWDIGVSKTGYIHESGKCLVMQAWLANKPMVIVLLDSWGKLTRIGDANRIKKWIENAAMQQRQVSG